MIMFLLMVDNHECSASPDTRTSVVVVFIVVLSLLCSHDNVFVDGC